MNAIGRSNAPSRAAHAAHAGLLGLLLLQVACGDASSGSPPPLQADQRLSWLLQPFPRDDYYDVDTSDPVGILVSALRHGHRDPLKAARKQLAEEGQAGVDAVRRVIEQVWNDPDRFNDIRNALDALAYSELPAALEVVRKVLDHPAAIPRQAAWRALRQHPDPADYDRVHRLFEEEGPELRLELARVLFDLDPARAEDEFTAWLADGRYPDLGPDLVKLVGSSRRPRTAQRCCSLWQEVEGGVLMRAPLAACCARTGDEQALAQLRAWQRGELEPARRVAVHALADAGLAAELVWTLERDPDPSLRQRAAHALAVAEDLDPTPHLLSAMSDADATVAAFCTQLLVRRGNRAAIEAAVSDLSSTYPGALDQATLTLQPVWDSDPELARRCLEVLLARHREEEHRAIEERRGLVRAIGQLPLREAAAWLERRSRIERGTMQGIPAARWVVLQIANTGAAGQRFLVEALAEEHDLRRRLDRIEALSATTTEISRGWLLRRAEAEDVPPYELLFVADRLTRMGPARLVAPVLKRATLRVEQDDVRRALQGLLWMWYPAPEPG